MNKRRFALGLAIVGPVALLYFVQAAHTREVPDQPAGVEVQARGPVHEAFAQPGDHPARARSGHPQAAAGDN